MRHAQRRVRRLPSGIPEAVRLAGGPRWLQPRDTCGHPILNLRLTYAFAAVATPCFAVPEDPLGSRLGHLVLAGMSLFWIGRIVEQSESLRSRHWLAVTTTVAFIAGAVLLALPVLSHGSG